MKTTIDLPEALYQSACEFAAAENTPLPELLAALVRRLLTDLESKRPADEDMVDWRGELL